MKDGRKNPRITPHDEEDDWDWKADSYQIQKELEEETQIKKEVEEATKHGSKEENIEKENIEKENSI